jgi:hypothetical protein
MKKIQMVMSAWMFAAALTPAATPTDSAGIEFFEKKIRPVFAEYCHDCHSHKATKLKAGLYLDTREGMLRGSESGEVVIPGEPEKSRLIQAIRYADPDLQMPPKKKLSDAAIADLVEWVKMGAPWPGGHALKISAVIPKDSAADTQAFLNERRGHWAYQPVRRVAVPAVKDPAWGASDIDSFILAKLEENGLAPAPRAERRTLIRRATYDLIGLPPAPDEVEDFLKDSSPGAFAKVVDRLLASPHYGERWARHWLDLVRFSETLGFEFDFDLYNVWRYRDYVIRAFNIDLPYNQFVLEHLAGDLVSEPRRDPVQKFNESIVATGFFWMGEGRQTPVDIRQEQADVIDGQIDVLGKAFLGQTIACARCHDHKFDAITTQDYYALAGYLKSSRYQQAFIDPPDRISAKARQLAALKTKLRKLIATESATSWLEQASQGSRYLLAAQKLMSATDPQGAASKQAARLYGLDEQQVERWAKALEDNDANRITASPDHPLHAWIQLCQRAGQTAEQFATRRQTALHNLRAQENQANGALAALHLYENFRQRDFAGWYSTGAAFDAGPAQSGDFIVGNQADRPIAQLVGSGAHSGLLSRRLQGELRSPTFTIEKPYIHYQIAGQHARLNLVIDGYTLIMNPMYGGLTITPTNERPVWQTMAVDRWIGQRAYIEISDSSIPVYRLNPPPFTGTIAEGPGDGYIEVRQIYFSGERTPPPSAPNRLNLQALELAGGESLEALAVAYEKLIIQEVERWRSGAMADSTDQGGGVALLNWLLQNGLLDHRSADGPVRVNSSPGQETRGLGGPRSEEIASLLAQYREIEAALPSPLRAPALADGTGEDEFVFIRGNYKTLGERASRRLPEVLANSEPSAPTEGSGRLELARRLVDPSNPLVARVMVNRIWKHHFGEGIVRTPDDFGRMGQPPTHPELLDYLASEFIRRGWSFKEMHRLMMLTSAYQMSSRPDPAQTPRDPENRLLHHMPVRRLEAEAIRDAILAVSGRLSRTISGPSVLPHLTAHMEGRGRPASGPLDTDGRRTIYINARRNFPVPMLVAFDYPINFSTNGRRVVSTVPEQAMTLMNDPFIVQQSERWAGRALAEPGKTFEQRVDALYQAAFSRSPSDAELRHAMAFLKEQKGRYGCEIDDPKTWTDLCHVLINVKEFIFIE